MNKKGELTSSTIVSRVILIIGFVILLVFLLVILDLRQWTEEEICAASILARATSPDQVQDLFALECTTKKICITFEDNCEQYLGVPSSEIQKIKLSKTNYEKSAERIEEISANEKYACWKMSGEGKLDIHTGGTISLSDIANLKVGKIFGEGSAKPICLICSRLAISKEFRESSEGKEILKRVNVNDYLENNLAPGSDFTYLQEFTDRKFSAFPGDIEEQFTSEENKGNVIKTDQVANIFTQIRTDTDPGEAALGGAKLAGGIIFGTSYGLGATGKVIKTTVFHPVAALLGAVAVVGGTAALNAYDAARDQEISVAYCGKFARSETPENDKESNTHGCSIITTVNYNNRDKINEMCSGGIMGKP